MKYTKVPSATQLPSSVPGLQAGARPSAPGPAPNASPVIAPGPVPQCFRLACPTCGTEVPFPFDEALSGKLDKLLVLEEHLKTLSAMGEEGQP